jgi:hypothetical protein
MPITKTPSLKKKSEKKAKEPEYRFLIEKRVDERTNEIRTVVQIQTIKEFVSFQYRLVLESAMEKRTITIRIKGFDTPSSMMPSVGPAIGHVEFGELKGKYEFRIFDLEEKENLITAIFKDTKIQLKEETTKSFIVIGLGAALDGLE